MRRIAPAVAGLLLVGLAWFFILPAPMGHVTYVTTYGTSMEPKIHKGDLILVRPSSEYKIGDAIAYKSGTIHQIVLHRIISVEGDRFVMKGDNNNFIDGDKPTSAQVIGKQWIHLPGAGNFLQTSRMPALLAIFSGGAVFAVRRIKIGSRRPDAPEVTEHPRIVMPRLPQSEGPNGSFAIAIHLGAGALCLALLGVGFSSPVYTQSNREVTLNHNGNFEYSTSVPGSDAVYQDDQLRTGDPIYARLVNRVHVSFKYRLETDADLRSQGTIQMYAEVRDTSGWVRRVTIGEQRAVEIEANREIQTEGDLDVAVLREMTQRLEEMTGLSRDSYTVEIHASVKVAGEFAGQPFSESFEPELTFGLDELQMQLQVATGKPEDVLFPRGGGLVQLTFNQPNKVAGLPVLFLRSSSVLGIGVLIVVAAAGLFRRYRGVLFPAQGESEPDRIRRKYGRLLLPVSTFQVSVSGRIHEVSSFKSLVRLANLHSQVVYTWEEGNAHTYVVECDGAAHRYVTGESEAAAQATQETH